MSEHHYEGELLKLSKRLLEGIKLANKKYNTQHGFIGLLIRDPSIGNIDIIHNCNNSENLIHVLELTIKQLKES